jgi:hypothetical protein
MQNIFHTIASGGNISLSRIGQQQQQQQQQQQPLSTSEQTIKT